MHSALRVLKVWGCLGCYGCLCLVVLGGGYSRGTTSEIKSSPLKTKTRRYVFLAHENTVPRTSLLLLKDRIQEANVGGEPGEPQMVTGSVPVWLAGGVRDERHVFLLRVASLCGTCLCFVCLCSLFASLFLSLFLIPFSVVISPTSAQRCLLFCSSSFPVHVSAAVPLRPSTLLKLTSSLHPATWSWLSPRSQHCAVPSSRTAWRTHKISNFCCSWVGYTEKSPGRRVSQWTHAEQGCRPTNRPSTIPTAGGLTALHHLLCARNRAHQTQWSRAASSLCSAPHAHRPSPWSLETVDRTKLPSNKRLECCHGVP